MLYRVTSLIIGLFGSGVGQGAISITQFNGDMSHSLDTSNYAGGVVHDWVIWQDMGLCQPVEGTPSANFVAQSVNLASLNGGAGPLIESMNGGDRIGPLTKVEDDNGVTWSHNDGPTNLYPLVRAGDSGAFNWVNGSYLVAGSMNGTNGIGPGNYSNYTNGNESSADFNINRGDGFLFELGALPALGAGGFYELRVFYATFAVPVEFMITNGADSETFTTGLGYERGYISFQIDGASISSSSTISVLTRDTDDNGNFGIMGAHLQSNVASIPELSSMVFMAASLFGLSLRRCR